MLRHNIAGVLTNIILEGDVITFIDALESSYCAFGLKEIIDFRTLFSTTKCFGSKKFARVSHKKINSSWFDICQKENPSFFGSQSGSGLKPLVKFTR